MIEVSSMRESIRMEGPNIGCPVFEVILGRGEAFVSAVDLIKEVMLGPSSNSYLLFKGNETTQVGMGEVAKSLYQLGYTLEMETSGSRSLVSWFNAVRCWVVDYIEGGLTDYFSLRKSDALRFHIADNIDLERTLKFLNLSHEDLLCQTYIKLDVEADDALFRKVYNLAKHFKSLRLIKDVSYCG